MESSTPSKQQILTKEDPSSSLLLSSPSQSTPSSSQSSSCILSVSSLSSQEILWFDSTFNSSPISRLIPLPLWKLIILNLSKEKENLRNLRLVCKLFRNLSILYWTQIIPDEFDEYFISKFGFPLT